MAVVRSMFIWLGVAVLTVGWFLLLLPVTIVAWPFDRKKNVPHYIARTWARELLWVDPGCRVRVEGEEHLAEIGGNGSAVLCANHQSMADIIALYYLGYPFKWISKREIAFVPLIGWAMYFAGYIFLKRGDKESIRRCMEKSNDWLRRGVSIMMFPEGTRSFDGRIKQFKDGAFRMAIESNRPVVPVALKGTRDLVEKGSWKFSARTDMAVRVGPPIRPREGADPAAELDRLKDETREWILRNVAELEGVAEAALDAKEETARFGNNRTDVRVGAQRGA